MAPNSRIYLTRHAQAEHNVADDYSIPDPPLTALGRQQAASLPSQTPELQQRAQVIISSPLKRTLQTTVAGYQSAIQRLGKGNVVVLPQLQECNDFPCDTGSPASVLAADPEFSGLNLSLLTPDWTSKKGFWAADPASLCARAQWVRQYLRSRPEQEIVVVAHGDVLRYITSREAEPWKNAEVRLYEFDPAQVNSDLAPLRPVGGIAAAGTREPTSGEISAQQGASGPNSGSAGVLQSVLGTGSLDLGPELNVAADEGKMRAVAEMEQRLKEKQSAVQSQATELQELEARLAAAERKRAELEAKGVKI